MRFRLLLALGLCTIALLTIIAFPADAQTSSNSLNTGKIVVQGYVSKATGAGDIPIAGAQIYFILNNAVVANATSNPVGFYAVSLPPSSGYTVAVSLSGFQSQIIQKDFLQTQSYNIRLDKIPFNGYVPYALNPVLETSPGRAFDCTIVVQNYQIVDQMVTFNVDTGNDMLVAWFPEGEALMVRSGDTRQMTFKLKYTGTTLGPKVVKVTVNGGAYFAEIPVVVVIKDLPFEEISFWTYAPEKVVRPGDTVSFVINAENLYAQDKDLRVNIDKPDGWSVTTGNGTEFYIPDGKTGSSNLWVYVPQEAKSGNYTINLTVFGQGVRSNALLLKVRVEGRPMYDAIISGQNRSAEGYPQLNLSPGQPFSLRVRIYNSWDFPVSVQATAGVGDNWDSYIDGVPNGHVYVDPGKAQEFTVKSRVPNETYGNFTAKVYLESESQSMTLLALITVPEPPPAPPGAKQDWAGIVLTGATAATFAVALGASVLRRLK
ncbi:MAG TPA: carboxypeptidase regulatory-like domain-containing protein [Methanocella sp.]|jgi:uncharacterized membrane protein